MAMVSGQESLSASDQEMAQAVEEYLRVLALPRPRGRPPSREALAARIDELESRIASASGLTKLRLIQDQIDLEDTLAVLDGRAAQQSNAEQRFVAVAADYSTAARIDYRAWRKMGVPASVLRAAGIVERRRRRSRSTAGS